MYICKQELNSSSFLWLKNSRLRKAIRPPPQNYVATSFLTMGKYIWSLIFNFSNITNIQKYLALWSKYINCIAFGFGEAAFQGKFVLEKFELALAMAGTSSFFRLLVIFLVISHLVCLNAIPVTSMVFMTPMICSWFFSLLLLIPLYFQDLEGYCKDLKFFQFQRLPAWYVPNELFLVVYMIIMENFIFLL